MHRLYIVLLISAGALFAQSAGEPADARGWLDRGAQALANSKYAEATDDFQRAVEVDPSNVNARLRLAGVFVRQYVPGSSTPDNVAFADRARAVYEQVLTLDPEHRFALRQLGSLDYQLASGASDPAEKVRLLDEARGLVREASCRQSAGKGSLVQPRCDRLGEMASEVAGGSPRVGDEAGGHGSDSE
jgi:tetratricopeptide (TPR) repeat protein